MLPAVSLFMDFVLIIQMIKFDPIELWIKFYSSVCYRFRILGI